MLALLFVVLRLQHAMEAVATETHLGAAPLFRPDRCGSDLGLFLHGIDNFVDRKGREKPLLLRECGSDLQTQLWATLHSLPTAWNSPTPWLILRKTLSQSYLRARSTVGLSHRRRP
jgi:hypothetical protein